MTVQHLWLGLPWVLLVAAAAVFKLFAGRIERNIQSLRAIVEAHSNEVTETLVKSLTPTIHVHDGRRRVATRAAEIVYEATHQESIEARWVTFYGAASLSTGMGAGEPDSAAEAYRDSLRKAAQAHVRMRRYISLFTEEELSSRSLEVAVEYLKWLERQYRRLQEDELYKLYDVVRAPKWGANMARILTHSTVMEISGNGRAALVIEDPQMAAVIRDYARDAVEGRNPRNPATPFGLSEDGSLQNLAARIGQSRSVVENLKRKTENE